MTINHLSRRSILAALGAGAAASVPLLYAGRTGAAETKFPTRLLIVSCPDGVFQDAFWPSGGETDFVIDPGPASILAPLLPFRNKILLVGGLDNKNMSELQSGSIGPFGGHSALPFNLSGARGVALNGEDGYNCSACPDGPTIDQYVAKALLAQNVKSRFGSLVLATRYGSDSRNLSDNPSLTRGPINGEPQFASVESNPLNLYNALFGEFDPADPAATRKTALNRTVQNFSPGALTRFMQPLGTDDRRKIDAHLTAVQELQQQLSAPVGCVRPPQSEYASLNADKNPLSQHQAMRAFNDLTTLALSCDLTRVATISWQGSIYCKFDPNQRTMTPLGKGDDPEAAYSAHTCAHDVAEKRGEESDLRKKLFDRYFFSELAYLLGKLDAVVEGDGTLLDHTAVLFANNMSDGAFHYTGDKPWILAGGGNGYFRTGRMIRRAGGRDENIPHNGLLILLANAMGVPTETFGEASYGGELTVLR